MMRFFGRSPVSESPVPGSPSTPLPAASSNMSPGPARPIRLVYADEKGKFHMDPEAVALLQLVKQPVGVVSVCGRARQGKSYILNQLLGRSSGFQVASTHRPCTKGLWLWSTPIRRTAIDGTEYSLLLLDSEGIDAYDQTGTYSAQIFSLAVLLSSMFIYNQMGGIDEAALDRLSLVTEMTKHIRVRASGGRSTASEIGQFSPIFVWLLRDFYLELEEDGEKITPRDYLEIALKPVGGVRKDVGAKNEIRDSIRALFPDRECFTLVRPLNDEADLQRLDQIRPDKLRPEFKSGLDSLMSFVFERSRPKQIGGTAMTGPIFARITQSYLDALNNGAVPTITSSWQSVEEAECQRAYELSTEVYMSSFDRSKPPEEAALREAHEDAVQKSMATFNDNAVGAGQVRQKYEKRLQTFFKKAFEDIKKDAFLNAYLHCTRTLETMERELRAACHAPGAKVDTVLKVLDGLLSKYEASCHGPEKWQKLVVFLRQSLEGPLLDFIKKQIDLIESEKISLALKCRSIEDNIELLNKQLETSEDRTSEYLKRYQDAMKDKEKLTDDYMGRINNLQKKYSSLEEKSSSLLKTLDTARQECVDWERKYDLVLSKLKAEEEQFGAEVAMLRSKSSATEARLGAAQEKAQSAQEEAEEWKRKYDIAVRETKNALEKAAAIQERTAYHTQSREAALREEFSCALAEKEDELKGKATRIEEAEQRLMTLSMELKAADSKVKSYDQETSRLKLEIKDLGEKVESANTTALSAQSKARSLEQEKIHLEQKYRSQFERFEEILGRCKAAETEAKRKMDLADEARAEAASAQKDKSEFQRVAMERLAQIERAERHAKTLERQNVDLVNEVERCRAGEMDALFKVKMLEERIVEKEKDVDMMLQSNNSQMKITAQTLEALLDSERAAHAEANNRAVALSIQLQVTQGKLDEVSQELTALRFCEKSTLDGKLRSASHGRTDDYEIGVDSVHERGTDDKVTKGNKRSRSSNSPLKDKGNKRSRSSSSPLKLGSPEDGGSGSVFRGDDQINSQQTNQDYTKFTKDKLKQVLTSSGFGDEVLNLGKDPKRPELLALCKKYVVAKANS